MPYAQSHSLKNNAAASIAAVAIQGLAVLGIVSAFGVHLLPKAKDPPVAGYQLPAANKPKPEPSPTASRDPIKHNAQTSQSDRAKPEAEPSGMPSSGFEFGTLGSDEGSGGSGGLGEVEFPRAEPSAQPTIPARSALPRGDQSRWVTQTDYPAREIAAGHEGLTRVRLSIGVTGRVNGCEVIASSGWPRLDEAACDRLNAHARFDPATDLSGIAVIGSYSTSVRWRLPE